MRTIPADISPQKLFLFLFLVASAVTLPTGCHRSYQDSQLVGSWLISTNRSKQTYTFAADHQMTIQTESSKNLTMFGDWGLTNGQLVMVIRSNSWSPNSPVFREPATIDTLTTSRLVLVRQNDNGDPEKRTFTRK